MAHYHHRLIIIGAGPAGYTAAIYAARALHEPVLITGLQPGGQLTITTDVENYPGFADVIQGPWLMEQMEAQARHCGAQVVYDTIAKVDFTQRPLVLYGDSGDVFTADAVILATGAQAKWLGIPAEETFRGFGVSACATCDGFFYRQKNVMVIGGGNTAVEEALYLAQLAAHVTLVHRRDSLKAERVLQQRLLQHPKISVLWDSALVDLLGSDQPRSVTHAIIENTKTKERHTHTIDGVFVAIGHQPATAFLGDAVRMKHGGFVWTEPGTTRTSVPGVFAAGDVADEVYRQAVTAAGLGCMAALDADRFLQELAVGSVYSSPQGVVMSA